MRLKPRFSEVLQQQRTAGNRRYTAKTANEPQWPQSKTFRDFARDNRSLTPTPTKVFVAPRLERHKWHQRDKCASARSRPLPVRNRIWCILALKRDMWWQYFTDFPDNQLTKFRVFNTWSRIFIYPLNFYEASRFVHPYDGRSYRHNGETDNRTNRRVSWPFVCLSVFILNGV